MTAKKYILIRAMLCVGLVAATLFLSVGYAALTDTLMVSGEVKWQELQAIYITSVTIDESNTANTTGTLSVSKVGHHVIQYGDFKMKQKNKNNPGCVTVVITVKNNSGKLQYFQECIWENEGQVTVLPDGIQIESAIEQGDEATIVIKIQTTDNKEISMNGKELTLVFTPQFDASDTEEASKNIAEIFKNVLDHLGPGGNGESIVVGGHTYTADEILSELKRRMTDNPGTGDYMGNVAGAPANQKEIINAIFGDAFIQIGNQTYSVNMLIKEQEINGDSRPDMVLYVTADQLDVGSPSRQELNYVPVFGIVFVNTSESDDAPTYEQCDHMFEGEAPVCNFSGNFSETSVGNFNTNQWRSTEFDVTDGSAGGFNQNNNNSDGELNEAYDYYITHVQE